MTHEEATALARERAAQQPDAGWMPRERAPADWDVVRVSAPGLTPTSPSGTHAETADQRAVHDDPRPAAMRDVPPYGPA